MHIKPLEFEKIFSNVYRAPAPLFGNIRVEKYGQDWAVQWSVPGFCDSFVSGEFVSEAAAMEAAQVEYERAMLNAIEHT